MKGRRSGEGMAALGRKAGPMRHRLQPRGGARNEQAELMEEFEMEQEPPDLGCTLPPRGWWCSREPDHEGPCAARPKKECLHWTLGDGKGGLKEHFVSPFDPPFKIRCQCPGECPGTLVIDGPNVRNTFFFLVCDTCGCAYHADVVR